MTTHALASVAGYRLLEVIGVGESAAVYLAEPPGERTGEIAPKAVVLKVCRGPSAQARVAECQVLLDHPVPGMPRLLDATRLPTGEQVIVMSFCAGRSLRSHSAGAHRDSPPRAWQDALERLVSELHAAGVAHGGIDAGDVLVDHDGTVSLLGFGATRRRGEDGFERAVATDRSAVRRLIAQFAAEHARATADGTVPAPSLRDDGFDQHFDEAAWAWRERETETIEAPEQTVAAVLEPAYLALVEGSRGIRSLALAGVRRGLQSRRRKLIAGAVVAVVGLAGALCVSVPPQDAVAATDRAQVHSSVPDPPPVSVAAPPVSAAAPPVSASAPPVSAEPEAVASSSAGSAGPADDAALRADDPVAAATALLRERETCLRAPVSGCLERVDEGDSPALRLDRAATAAVTRGDAGEGPSAGGTASPPVLVQRIGATAILTVALADGTPDPGTTKPASLLVVRGEAGWRIRSFDPF